MLRAENDLPHVCGMFYKAMVQVVLLFRSETWNISPSTMKCLKGFHLKAPWCISGMVPKSGDDGTWIYTSSKVDILEADRLHTVSHYIEVYRQTIASFVLNWSIFDLCKRGVMKRGSILHQF